MASTQCSSPATPGTTAEDKRQQQEQRHAKGGTHQKAAHTCTSPAPACPVAVAGIELPLALISCIDSVRGVSITAQRASTYALHGEAGGQRRHHARRRRSS